MTTKIIIHKSDNNLNNFKIKQKSYVPVVSYVKTSSNLISRLHKYKIYTYEKIKQIEHNINSEDGVITTGTINIHNPSYIYNIDEDNDKSIVNKEYVDTHGGGIDKTKPLHLQGIPSLTTTGNIIAGYNSLDESQNKLVVDASTGNVNTKGNITANSISAQLGTIESVEEEDNAIINRKYYYDNMTGVNPDVPLHLNGTPSLTTTGNVIIGYDKYTPENNKITVEGDSGNIITVGNITANNIEINNGTISSPPLTNTSIVNKEYVDNTCILKDTENEQVIEGPLDLQNSLKISTLLIPITSN